MRSLSERFWEKVEKTRSCWIWKGHTRGGGYGAIRLGHAVEGSKPAHIVSWEMKHGPIPKGLFVLHKCDNRPCIRPSHLRLGTQLDNMRDMISKGRSSIHVNGHAPHVRLNQKKVREIRNLFDSGDYECSEIADMYGVYKLTIYNVVNYKTWAWVK